MTVSYQYEVASSTSGGFTRLLLMWRGSLYKLIYRELVLFVIMFASLSAIYRHALTDLQKREFEKFVIYCDTFINLIPLSFVLGFYVSHVADRWWKQYNAIPWPDKVMHLVALYVSGDDEYGRMLRRGLMRYLNLSLILVLRSISSAVKRRFPTLDHVVDSGFMTSLELDLFQSVPSLEFNTYWIPCTWFINLLKEARRNHRLPDAQGLKIIMEEFNDFRSKCGLLWSYDWVSIPLVYTQVVTLATYSFFAVALVGRQYIEGNQKQFQLKVDIYCPLFTILQFFFFMGLLKVAEQLINPFGDDDEDFELNWLIDRHVKVSYLGVDTLMTRCPPLVKDIYFDAENLILPYTEAAAAYKRKTYRGSVADMPVPEEKQTMFLPGILEEEEEPRNTPRTSSASLVTHTDSPMTEKRQISGSPQTTPSMVSNSSETVLQLDNQEQQQQQQQCEAEQGDQQRRRLTGAMRKFSAIARHTNPRIESNRKPFFAAIKTPKILLQPWPSATNLSGINRHRGPDTPAPFTAPKILCVPPALQISFTDEAEDQENREGFDNSAFFHEDVDDRYIEDQDDNTMDKLKNVKQFERFVLADTSECSDAQLEAIDLQRFRETIEQRSESFSNYLLQRQCSSTGSSDKKGVHWRTDERRPSLLARRKTIHSVPTSLQIIIPQARSSPNLTNIKVEEKKVEKLDTSDESEKDTKV
ncbi:bestrophin-4-like isoform X1 [Vespa mandarinia]|uniref:bestrophin-4-like isoform X1 n=1 Tax=Vespa mandarinia TaxID=7446 RepID=UPI001616928C|nr:bestrophin-4-like isoform X1 [Vespa mandarinia]XP_035729406.1 bestrophin-4-like isoform X1 [Vespa mandarinia]XP_035729407.1 bestrophin-4-like isoform X1 [Vespa mandarinia]XP_035729408.1 bestrophin-4-like isoform X1 [Vespa mandarinia]XP_035729409.1 bestrophin-4-like isoform X1 [Vespa mandarinia]